MKKASLLLLLFMTGCILDSNRAIISAKDTTNIEACQTIGFTSIGDINDHGEFHIVCVPKETGAK